MNKCMVIKIGGAILTDNSAKQALFETISVLQEKYHVVLVHGGGNNVQHLLEKLSLKSEKLDGVRITPQEHIPYVVGALSGTVNTQLCADGVASGIKPVGCTLSDAASCWAVPEPEVFGAVAKAKPNSPDYLQQLLTAGLLPVISSIALSEDGQQYNVNADDAAASVAQLLKAELILLSDVAGVLDGQGDLLKQLDATEIECLINQDVINGGMVVKVKSALTTAQQIGLPVTIAGWKNPQVLTGVLTHESVGTQILPNGINSQSSTLKAS